MELVEILNQIPQDDKILFKSEKYTNKKLHDLFLYLTFIVSWIGFDLLLLALDGFNFGRYAEDPSLIFGMLIINPQFAGLITLLFYFVFKIRREHYLVITDKKIYVYVKQNNMESTYSFELSSIKAIGFRRKWYDRKNSGIIDLISNNYKNEVFSIKFVPELFKVQKMLEYILLEYGNIEQRALLIKNKLNNEHSHIFKVSLEKYIKVKKRLHSIYLGLGIGITVVVLIGFVVRYFTNIYFLLWYSFFMSCFAFGFIIVFGQLMYYLSKNCSSLNDILIFEEDKLTLLKKNKKKIIHLNDKIVFKTLKISDTSYGGTKVKILGILIKEVYNSKNYIKFGPVDNFDDICEYLFCGFITWKKEKGFLLSTDQILDEMTK
ncbi:MAG: hypothetical protein ACFFCM_11725 [Promethearchaeota archaeon]